MLTKKTWLLTKKALLYLKSSFNFVLVKQVQKEILNLGRAKTSG